VVEGARLESVYRGNSIEGSNPSLSASYQKSCVISPKLFTSLPFARLERLSARFRPHAVREFTLEELSRLYWRMDKRGFQAMAREHPMFGFFVRCFEREDAERATPVNRGAPGTRGRR
jgi:hypothetical protein